MAEWKCPFCGSKELKIETPFMKVSYGTPANPGSGKPERQFTYCCRQQAANAKYVSSHRDYKTGETLDIDKIAKWK